MLSVINMMYHLKEEYADGATSRLMLVLVMMIKFVVSRLLA